MSPNMYTYSVQSSLIAEFSLTHLFHMIRVLPLPPYLRDITDVQTEGAPRLRYLEREDLQQLRELWATRDVNYGKLWERYINEGQSQGYEGKMKNWRPSHKPKLTKAERAMLDTPTAIMVREIYGSSNIYLICMTCPNLYDMS